MGLPTNNNHTLEALMDAFDEYHRAKNAHDSAREVYTGYSWGYAGETYVASRDRARARFVK